jgi:cytochrome P450
MAGMSMEDFSSQAFKRNPFAVYTQLLKTDPLQRIRILGRDAWLVTDYDDAESILKDNRISKDLSASPVVASKPHPDTDQAFFSNIASWRRDLLTTDPPDHTRLRTLVTKAFTPTMIEALRPRIQQIADGLLDAAQPQESMDLIADFAFPLPITVISEMLGVPLADRDRFRAWTQVITVVPDTPEQQQASAAAQEEFVQYIRKLIAEKRAMPAGDLISSLIRAEENGDSLNEKELISMIWLLIVAGHETTVNLIGNGTLELLKHPDQMRLLRDDPSLIPTAVEELLRFTSPVDLSTGRWAHEDIPIRDRVIHKGEAVFIALGATNMDPQAFPSPERLDVARKENKHLAFGKGIHYCLGAPLARLEGQIAFATLLRRLPGLRLAVDPDQLIWKPSVILRGLTSLLVTF